MPSRYFVTGGSQEALSPVLLGSGEALFAGLDLPKPGYSVAEHAPSPLAQHVVLTRA